MHATPPTQDASHLPMDHTAARQFTLIELLVVVAIIAVLASLLLPALTEARAMAKVTSCLNRHKQLHLGLMMYYDDNSDLRKTLGAAPQYSSPEADIRQWNGAAKGRPVGLGILLAEGYLGVGRALWCAAPEISALQTNASYRSWPLTWDDPKGGKYFFQTIPGQGMRSMTYYPDVTNDEGRHVADDQYVTRDLNRTYRRWIFACNAQQGIFCHRGYGVVATSQEGEAIFVRGAITNLGIGKEKLSSVVLNNAFK